MDAELQRLVDHQAIVQVLNRYAFALDDRDWSALRSCFTPDAIYTFSQGEERRVGKSVDQV